MKESSNDGTCERVFCCCQSKEKDELRSQKADAEVRVDHVPVRLQLLPQEDANGDEQAHDGDGEADVGDGVKVGLGALPRGMLAVENEGKVGQVGAGALCVSDVVTHLYYVNMTLI